MEKKYNKKQSLDLSGRHVIKVEPILYNDRRLQNAVNFRNELEKNESTSTKFDFILLEPEVNARKKIMNKIRNKLGLVTKAKQ